MAPKDYGFCSKRRTAHRRDGGLPTAETVQADTGESAGLVLFLTTHLPAGCRPSGIHAAVVPAAGRRFSSNTPRCQDDFDCVCDHRLRKVDVEVETRTVAAIDHRRRVIAVVAVVLVNRRRGAVVVIVPTLPRATVVETSVVAVGPARRCGGGETCDGKQGGERQAEGFGRQAATVKRLVDQGHVDLLCKARCFSCAWRRRNYGTSRPRSASARRASRRRGS